MAFLEFWWALLSPLGHTVIFSALNVQPLLLKILGSDGKEVPGSQGLPCLESRKTLFPLEPQN